MKYDENTKKSDAVSDEISSYEKPKKQRKRLQTASSQFPSSSLFALPRGQ